jgi:hypothetical protein
LAVTPRLFLGMAGATHGAEGLNRSAVQAMSSLNRNLSRISRQKIRFPREQDETHVAGRGYRGVQRESSRATARQTVNWSERDLPRRECFFVSAAISTGNIVKLWSSYTPESA